MEPHLRRAGAQHRAGPRGPLRAASQHHQRFRRRAQGMNNAAEDASLRPYGLQTEQRHEPLGLDDPRPRLSWKLASAHRGAAQSAYRITAAERAVDLDDGARLVWDSGTR